MFEADRLLKNLMLGRNNLTEKKFKAHVKGYSNLLDMYAEEKRIAPTSIRMWFVPEKISLVQSEDRTSMVFDQVRMQVLTENKFKKHNYHDPIAEKFAAHFTQNYDAFAQQFSVLHELKKLGKITGIVKWIKEQGLPFDLSFFKSYIPQLSSTPSSTKQITVSKGFNSGGVIFNLEISGGVIYHLDDKNFSSTTNWQANESKEEVLQARPREEELSWDFGRGYTAVAQTFGKTLKVGDDISPLCSWEQEKVHCWIYATDYYHPFLKRNQLKSHPPSIYLQPAHLFYQEWLQKELDIQLRGATIIPVPFNSEKLQEYLYQLQSEIIHKRGCHIPQVAFSICPCAPYVERSIALFFSPRMPKR